jgi:Relaxase/Mobilisation nuclease domain
MIPRIQTGTSFQGAGLYYLHDKKLEGETERLTTERVAWTYAINTVENDPEAVLAEMRQTSFDQPILKMLSGNRIDGRPTETPVMTVALAWSPEQNPTRNQMIEAGHSYLQHMGWEAHQALFVAHNDTKHPHMHMIITGCIPRPGWCWTIHGARPGRSNGRSAMSGTTAASSARPAKRNMDGAR